MGTPLIRMCQSREKVSYPGHRRNAIGRSPARAPAACSALRGSPPITPYLCCWLCSISVFIFANQRKSLCLIEVSIKLLHVWLYDILKSKTKLSSSCLDCGMLSVGCDVGTQGCKVLVYCRQQKQIVGRGAATYGLSVPRPGAAEQDPELWLCGLETAVAQALSGLDVGRVDSVGVSGQQHGLVLLDVQGAVLRPCKLWCDVESAPQAKAFSEAVGVTTPRAHPRSLSAVRTCLPHTSPPMPQLALPCQSSCGCVSTSLTSTRALHTSCCRTTT